MMKTMRLIVLPLAAAAMALVAHGDLFFDGSTGFSCVKSVGKVRCEKTKDALVLTDIRRDLEIQCDIVGVEPAKVESFDFRYRATGATPQPKAGGQLYYASLGSSFSDARRWMLPPLVRDGEWHETSVPVSAIVDYADWKGASNLVRFRFDVTDAEGGRIEIARFGFRTRGSASARVKPTGEKFGGEDAWPDVVPETFKTPVAKRLPVRSVDLHALGGTATPREQTAGGKVRLRYDYRGEKPDAAFIPVTVSLVSPAGALKWSENLQIPLAPALSAQGDDVWSLEFDYELPRYIASGDVRIRCESPCLIAVSGARAEARLRLHGLTVDPDWSKALVSKVETSGDAPVFSINGEKTYALWGTVSYGHRPDCPSRHSSAPLNFVTVWTKHLDWWPHGDVFDPTELDRLAEVHRRAYPGAYFIWDISIYPPPDWRAAHPDEMARDEQGNVNLDCGDEEVNFSFASRKAYDDMERVMRRVIDHLEHAPYANRIAGYRINSGHTVEWLGWDPSRKETILDFSPVAQKGFEAFAKAHYPWITDFSVPTLAERRALDDGAVLWDQRRHARTIAYHDFYSAAVADGTIRMCRAARAALGGRKLVGTYFGYTMTLDGDGKSQMRAHYALKRLLDAQAVDFLMSPQNYSYASRSPGTQITDMKPFATIQRHGVVSAIEEDTRTHNMQSVGSTQTLTEEMTVNILRRNMGVSLCRNQPYYTYAISNGTEFDFPRFADDADTLAKAGRHAVAAGVRRAAQIAVVVSEEAIKSTPMLVYGAANKVNFTGKTWQFYERNGKVRRCSALDGNKISSWAYNHFYTETARIGAGVDFLLAEDLEDNPGDYRFYIFNICTKLTPALRKAAERLRERDCTILWTYAPGYTSDDGNSVVNMKALTGMDFTLCADVTDPGVTLADGRTIGGMSCPKDGTPVRPIFAAAHPDKVLGRYANGAVGLAESRTGRARTIFSGSEFVEAPLLKAIARSAGVHLFAEDMDIYEANERFLSLHARNGGVKKVHLPRKTTVIDVFNRKLIARDTDTFTVDAPLHSSWLFYFGEDAEELLGKL